MVRRFLPDAPVDHDVITAIVELGLRAPSAGFSQGWDFVVLDTPHTVRMFWDATADDDEPDPWLQGLMTAPALILCCSDRNTYLRRYAEADKGWTDESVEPHWPVPYWDVDTGMAAMLMLLAAVHHDLGGLFFGVAVADIGAVKSAFAIPDDRNIVGVIALGHPDDPGPSGSTRTRRRRPTSEVVHRGTFGVAFGTRPSGGARSLHSRHG